MSFLTGLGLPHEDVFSLLNAPGQESMSRLNPLITYPAQEVFGRSLHQNRDLKELDPAIGRAVGNIGELVFGIDQQPGMAAPLAGLLGTEGRGAQIGRVLERGASNLPPSRLLSTIRGGFDPRKWKSFPPPAVINFLTGARIQHLSPTAQDAVLRDRVEDSMKALYGGRSFERTYVPEAVRERLGTESLRSLAQIDAVTSGLAIRAKKRKAQREATQQALSQ